MPPLVANENFVTTLLIFYLAPGPGGEVGLLAGIEAGFEFVTS